MKKHPALIVWLLLALFAIPFVVGLVVLHSPRWYPLLDMAQTELRVRDVWSSNPPLIGLAGRIGPFGADGGSHPGPLSFYALWPAYTVFGRSAYGMQVGNVVLDLTAIGLSLWMAFRRGGVWLTLGLAATIAVLLHAYGAFVLTLPWNPYLPVLWWLVFLLAVWSVFMLDFAMLPIAVFAGSFAMQTHISYLGLVGGLVVIGLIGLGVLAWRARGDRATVRRILKWTLIAAAFGVILWIPPVLDQIRHTPGNLTVIKDHFSSPPDPPIGFWSGLRVMLANMNPFTLVHAILVNDARPRPVTGSTLPGWFLIQFWIISGALAIGIKKRAIVVLDVVIGCALVLGLISSARIFGTVWYYLLLWAWVVAALMLFAFVWTLVSFFQLGHMKFQRGGAIILVAITVLFTAAFTIDAARVTVQSPRLNQELGALTKPTADALAQREKSGVHGPYLVTWLPDAEAIGSEGFGLLNELNRHGFNANGDIPFRPGATRYHVIDPKNATLQVHLATGPDIARWQGDSRFQQVATFDPRNAADRAEFDRLHGEVVSELQAAGHQDLVAQVDDNLFMLSIADNVAASTRAKMARMLALGMPAAVFIGPVGEPQ